MEYLSEDFNNSLKQIGEGPDMNNNKFKVIVMFEIYEDVGYIKEVRS